jgi:hypothetical protein
MCARYIKTFSKFFMIANQRRIAFPFLPEKELRLIEIKLLAQGFIASVYWSPLTVKVYKLVAIMSFL